MRYSEYTAPKRSKKLWLVALSLVLISSFAYWFYNHSQKPEKKVDHISFENSVSTDEKAKILQVIGAHRIKPDSDVRVNVITKTKVKDSKHVLAVYLPVTDKYSSRQNFATSNLDRVKISIVGNGLAKVDLASVLTTDETNISNKSSLGVISGDEAVFVPAGGLDTSKKLLPLNGEYYLDSFTRGAVFRQVEFSGPGAKDFDDVRLNDLPNKENVVKVNMSGVTALTRLLMNKLKEVKDPTYFSAKIGGYLADADVTHLSNEVSFKQGCAYSNTQFCSPPEFMRTIQASGADVVELTGNHNNDTGSDNNASTIKKYTELGIGTFGGGLNEAEARKPYIANLKGSKIAFLGYNAADGRESGVIAGKTSAGGNYYSDEKAKMNIVNAKQKAQFVIVDIQYLECQAYPDGYLEYPVCDKTISGQSEMFKRLIDYGADAVIGSSAHQPQTFEFYKNKPIYYGLGNLYFDQTRWPGTERGIILSHYFVHGKLIQTKLTPTVYDKDFQTRIMDEKAATAFLDRLNVAR